MADAALFVRWGPPIPGRERQQLEVLGEAMALCTAFEREGAIESFEPVLLELHGGDLRGFLLLGLGFGMSLTPLTSAAQRALPAAKAGAASGMSYTLRWIGGALGIALAGTLLDSLARDELSTRTAAAQPPDAGALLAPGGAPDGADGPQSKPPSPTASAAR